MLYNVPSGPLPVFCEVDFVSMNVVYADTKTAHKKALVTERYKLVRDDSTGRLELYDLILDPAETVDLSSSRPGVVRTLLGVLESRLDFARRGSTPAPELALPPEQIERLRELGYIEP